MSVWEEHRDEYHLEQAMEEAEYKLHTNINTSFTKALAQANKELRKKNGQ